MRLGVLDVGSNSVHLLLVDAHHGARPLPAHKHKIELRLAESLDRDGNIDVDAADRLVGFCAEALEIAEDKGAPSMLAFATSALREAGNGDDVIARVRAETGVDLTVLSGEDEARLTFLAVRRWFGWSSRRLLNLDIGGGSLEISTGMDEDPDVAISLPLGAGRVTRALLGGPRPDAEQIKVVRKRIRAEIASTVGRAMRPGAPDRVVGTSKTFRSLARIAGAAPTAEGPYVPRSLLRSDLSLWLPKVAAMTPAEREELPGVQAGRGAQLLAGALVADAVMDLFGVEQLDLCPWALREGLILRHLDRLDDPSI